MTSIQVDTSSVPGAAALPGNLADTSGPPPGGDRRGRRVKVFTVHGTFSNEAEWDNWDSAASDEMRRRQGKPRNFVNQLSDYLKSQGVIFDELDHTQYNWSGGNSHDERRTSAIGLKKLIERELSQTLSRVGKPYKEYYDGGVYVIAHSHGGTISRIAMNLWDKEAEYYGPERRLDASTQAVLFDELRHDDHCAHCRQQRNGDVGPNTVDRPDCIITFGSPFVTFVERSGGLLAARMAVWSFRFLTVLPLLAYFGFVMLTSADAGAGLLGVLGGAFADPTQGLSVLRGPAAETALLLVTPAALYWLLARYTPRRIVAQIDKWVGAGAIVNVASVIAKVLSLAALVALAAYYVAYLRGGKPGIAAWISVWQSPFVIALSVWLLPILLYWLLAISLPGRSLAGLSDRVALLRQKLPKKYDPREERQAFYLNYHTPGDEPGLGLRLQGFITWVIQALALSMACVVVAGIVLAVIGGLEALLLSNVMGGRGLLGSVGLSPKAGDQQWRFIVMMDVLTAVPALLWNGLAAIPGLAPILGGPAELRLGGLAHPGQVAEHVPFALFSAVMTMLFNLLPTILIGLAVAFGVGVWLRNSMAGFGAENFAWTLASRIAISKRAGPHSKLRKINISGDAWWNRDIAHCYYYKSDVVTKDVADFIAHPERLQPDPVGWAMARRVPGIARWLVAGVFVLGIFAAAVPIARDRQRAVAVSVPAVLIADRERAIKAGATFRECQPGCPTMVVIPAGSFMMGSADGEGPAS